MALPSIKAALYDLGSQRSGMWQSVKALSFKVLEGSREVMRCDSFWAYFLSTKFSLIHRGSTVECNVCLTMAASQKRNGWRMSPRHDGTGCLLFVSGRISTNSRITYQLPIHSWGVTTQNEHMVPRSRWCPDAPHGQSSCPMNLSKCKMEINGDQC